MGTWGRRDATLTHHYWLVFSFLGLGHPQVLCFLQLVNLAGVLPHHLKHHGEQDTWVSHVVYLNEVRHGEVHDVMLPCQLQNHIRVEQIIALE